MEEAELWHQQSGPVQTEKFQLLSGQSTIAQSGLLRPATSHLGTCLQYSLPFDPEPPKSQLLGVSPANLHFDRVAVILMCARAQEPRE